MSKKHLYFDETKYKRIIAISDIHGSIDLFNQLLAKIELTADDLLVLVGDYVNRGTCSLAVLRKVMALSQLPNCVVLTGNHEPFVYYIVKNDARRSNFNRFLDKWYYPTILHEMTAALKAQGAKLPADGPAICDLLYETYRAEFDFMNSMAVLLEGKSHIFVHAGYESHFCLPDNYEGYVKYDNYIGLTTRQAKTVVVGHWPISNYLEDRIANIPHFCRQKNVILLDGGLNIKSSGELNALLITPQNGSFRYDYLQVNDFEPVKVVAPFDYPNAPFVYVKYPDYAVECVGRGALLSRYRHIQSGRELTVFNCLVNSNEEGSRLKLDYLNTYLDAPIGADVLIAKSFEDCSLVKYGDAFYWAANRQLSAGWADKL
ncbi:MAG: hypothetical protein CSA13_01300 [Clostridiales bacterium]|nr:MAG: hypothetical protein CSA13_01300 [Clostridiales bacterium]